MLGLPMPPIANEGVDLGIGDAIVITAWGWAGEAVRRNPLGRATIAFSLMPGTDEWICRHGSGGALLAAGWTIVRRARFEQPVHAASARSGALVQVAATPASAGESDQHHHKQQHEPVRSRRHRQPHGMVSARARCLGRIRRGARIVKGLGSKGRIIHDEEMEHHMAKRPLDRLIILV